MRNLYYNIKRILSWIPILWKDRDWDYDHLFAIIAFKLNRMKNDEGYKKYLVRGNRYIRQLRYAEKLTKMIQDFDHYKQDEITEKYGEVQLSFEDCEESEYKRCVIKRNKLTPENKAEYYLDLEKNILKNEAEYNKLLDRWNRHIKRFHRNWWN